MTESVTIQRLALIAGEGQLPVRVAQNAKHQGLEVIPYVLGNSNAKQLKHLCNGKIHHISPGLLAQNLKLLQQENIQYLVFAGKVSKWLLLRNPRLDRWAIEVLQQQLQLNDDTIMNWFVDNLAKEGIEVLPQTDYLKELFLPSGRLTQAPLTEQEEKDIEYGFQIAKEMGRLDIGQSIVLKDGMLLAVEAIEGTDECLKRAGHWAKKRGGVVVKVAKPNQDQRFDVPTVGLRTLKTMKKAGLTVLATEANATLYLEPEEMTQFANQNGIKLVSV